MLELEGLALALGLSSLTSTTSTRDTYQLTTSSCSCYGLYKASETLDGSQSITLGAVSSTAATMLSGCSDTRSNNVQNTISYVEQMSDEDLSNLIMKLEEKEQTLEGNSPKVLKK